MVKNTSSQLTRFPIDVQTDSQSKKSIANALASLVQGSDGRWSHLPLSLLAGRFEVLFLALLSWFRVLV